MKDLQKILDALDRLAPKVDEFVEIGARIRAIEEEMARRFARKRKPTAEQRSFVQEISGLRVISGGKG
jgi:hypothetical protein